RHTSFSRDWSSDVCSSDLLFLEQLGRQLRGVFGVHAAKTLQRLLAQVVDFAVDQGLGYIHRVLGQQTVDHLLLDGRLQCLGQLRSEERRVGKDIQSRWMRQ